MNLCLDPHETLPVETVAWVSVRASVSQFLSDREISLFLAALQSREPEAVSTREVALAGFAKALSEGHNSVELAVGEWLAHDFEPDQCLALVAFAGMVYRFPEVCRLRLAK
jgi:hypothetical protein